VVAARDAAGHRLLEVPSGGEKVEVGHGSRDRGWNQELRALAWPALTRQAKLGEARESQGLSVSGSHLQLHEERQEQQTQTGTEHEEKLKLSVGTLGPRVLLRP
jgi:hypothetical protein